MDLVTGAVGSLIFKLGELLNAEYKLQKHVAKQYQSLIEELECAHAALREVAKVPPEQLDPQVRIWARLVREASYDMEDILDTFHMRIQGGEPSDKKSLLENLLEKMIELFKKSKSRHEIAGPMEEVRKRLQEVTDRRDRFTINSVVASPAAAPSSTVDPRLKAMYNEVAQLVGIDQSRGDLISKLSMMGDGHKQTRIVSVVGVGGLGKTTLAKASYDKVKSQYDCCAFVSVGRSPDLVTVFRNILFVLDKNKYKEIHSTQTGMDLLISEIQEFVGKKRYFIVIDDIWETRSLETIRLAFVESKIGSRIIITTRKLEIAKEADEIYKLQPLSDDNAKRLFYTRIFGSEGNCPDSEVDELSDKILKKCNGVPLAIITMASLLVGKSRGQWFEVCKTIGFRDKDSKQVYDTMWIMSLSYYDLPSHLKACLLYLSAFPEDYFIEKGSLIWKWIAEGIVERKSGIGLFELGEEYFHDLINRSMIRLEERDDPRHHFPIYGCGVHDMVLDLIRSLSGEQNFFTVSGNNDEGTLSFPSSCSSVRRLSHQNSTLKYTHLDNQNSVRSFIACRCNSDKGVPLQSFKLLRVLALESCRHVEGCYRLDHLGNLLHLRYLGIINTPICELPEEIGALKFLQVLILKGTHIKELPPGIGLLTRLVCLCARMRSVSNGIIGKLKLLEELEIYPGDDDRSKSQFVKEIGNLSELRVLRIDLPEMNEGMQSDLLQSVGNLHRVQHLELHGLTYIQDKYRTSWDAAVLPRHLRRLITPDVCFPCVPSCIDPSRLHSLSRLELHVSNLDEQGLKILGGLPELRYLKLMVYSTSTVKITDFAADQACFFQNLRHCSFPWSMVQFVLNEDSSVSFTLWDGWASDVSFGSRKEDYIKVAPAVMLMPNLEELSFKVRVWNLMRNNGSFDKLGLEYLPSLQKVTVCLWCWHASSDDVEKTEAALSRAIEVHPNRPKVQIDLYGKSGVSSQPGFDDLAIDEEEIEFMTDEEIFLKKWEAMYRQYFHKSVVSTSNTSIL